MSHRNPLDEWTQTLATQLPHLSKPQVAVLALWSFGMVLARSCCLTAVVDVLVPLLHGSFNTLRERLRNSSRGPTTNRGSTVANST